MQKTFLGIDIGTTGTKSMLFSEDNSVLGRGYKGYQLISPFDLAFEQNPNDWVDAVVESIKEATKNIKSDVLSLSVSAQGGSFFFARFDDSGKIIPLTNAYTWMDKRAFKESEELKRIVKDDEDIYLRTGSKIGAGTFPSRYLWAKKNIPEIVEKADIILSTSDYIYYILTGELVIDYTSAAMMDIFNVKEKCYDKELLSLLGLTEKKFPKLISAGQVIGSLLPEMAERLNLSTNLKVVCGAHDQYAANIGSNYFGGNDLLVSSGTTWVVFGNSPNLALNSSHFASCIHPFGGYGVFSSAVSSGVVIDWERNVFSLSYDDLNRELPLRPFEKDLLVYPFISGSGAYRGKNQSFAIDNVSFRFNQYDIVKATMEGVAFEIREIVNRFRKAGMCEDKIIIAGGAVRSQPWMKILATVLGKEIYISNQADRCCYGAYSLAKKGVATNEFVTFEFDGYVVYPDNDLVDEYTKKFELYSKKFTN